MVFVSSSIACIIARELLEMIMFVCSHFGAVSKSTTIDDATRHSYYKYLSIGIASGILGGLAISLGIGFGLRAIFNSGGSLEAEVGMEAGEAVSKLIGFVFVLKMMFKLPKWFGISNYGRIENQEYVRPNDPLGSHSAETALDSKMSMSLSLFWNTLRETAEAGGFTCIEAFLSSRTMHNIVPSVGIGCVAAFGFSLLMFISFKYGTALSVGIASSVIVEMLAIGLITGAEHSFEEISEMRGTGETPTVWLATSDTALKVVGVFGFFGLTGHFTAAQFCTWIGSMMILTYFQISHNVYGHALPFTKLPTKGEDIATIAVLDAHVLLEDEECKQPKEEQVPRTEALETETGDSLVRLMA